MNSHDTFGIDSPDSLMDVDTLNGGKRDSKSADIMDSVEIAASAKKKKTLIAENSSIYSEETCDTSNGVG